MHRLTNRFYTFISAPSSILFFRCLSPSPCRLTFCFLSQHKTPITHKTLSFKQVALIRNQNEPRKEPDLFQIPFRSDSYDAYAAGE